MRRPSLDLSEPSRNLDESLGSPANGASVDPSLDMALPPSTEEEEEELDLIEGTAPAELPRVYTPPPHIAARFYRPSQTRRKDSAASSRRNSISSVHSRSSHGCSRHAGPQSKYIAQHLRRASILEDRKARLADRAAHAEKVRLRAALAKSATRDTSVSEERAIAAQQARERNLAEIAAACAEEVKRAKAVAESMKEKREQEIRKLRMQMEERLAEAARRREELRSRNNAAKSSFPRARGQSQSMGSNRKAVELLPLVKEESKERETPPPISADEAAGKIQWWWRSSVRRRAVAEFQNLGLTIDGVRETSFEEVVKLLAQEPVLVATSKILRICGLQEGPAGSVNEMAAVRTFLSAFIILGHPSQVLSNKDGKDDKGAQEQVGPAPAQPLSKDDLANPQLQELVGKARDLLICFENILPRLTSSNNYTPSPALKAQLPQAYAGFHNAFIAWKARDSSALIEVMLMQFVELDAIWQAVKDSTDPSVTESYRQSIQDNQVMLLVRIKKLAGAEQGKKMVFEAVRKARKERAETKPAGDTKPREADHTVETAMGDLGTTEPAEKEEVPEHGPPSPLDKPSEKYITVEVRVPRNRLLPDNRVVVHELSINKQYRLSADEYKEQQAKFLAPLFQQMRATMQEDNQKEHFLLLLEVAKDLRAKLQRLVQAGKSMHAFIGEVLDTEMAYQQFLTGSFSYEKFFSVMGQLLPKLCAPVRDDEVKDLVENRLHNGHYVDRLEALMGFIDVMSSDHANYLLGLAAPQILQGAAQYEAKYFAQALDTKEHGLSSAEAAWRAARAKVLAEASRRDPEGVNHPRSSLRPTPDRIYTQMLVDVFTSTRTPATVEDMPEMLRLDHKRAVKCGVLTRRIVTAGAILLQCKNMLKRDVRMPWRNEAGRVMAVLETAERQQQQQLLLQQQQQEENNGNGGGSGSSSYNVDSAVDGAMAALEAGRSMPAATKANLRALVGKIIAAAAPPPAPSSSSPSPTSSTSGGNGDPSEPVLRLLLTRLRTHILARLAAASTSEKVRTASTAGEKLAGLGLAEFVDRVREMVDELAKVGAVDREAHGVWWEAVAEKVEGEESGSGSGAPRLSGSSLSPSGGPGPSSSSSSSG